MLQQLFPAIRATILITFVTGLLYPAAITGICQLLFKSQADGSLITRSGQVIGSLLIGQNFTKPEYFHPRPSNAGSEGYDASNSGGYNWGPTNQKLANRVKSAAAQFGKENPGYDGAIPADALTGSGSGLDPDISVANARIQAGRVARVRGLSLDGVNQLIDAATSGRDLGFLGEPRVSVLALNLSLDRSALPNKF